MSRFCFECGTKLAEDALFCPNCGMNLDGGDEESYEHLIKSILYIKDGNEYRISKAKAIGVVFAILIAIGNIIVNVPISLRMGAAIFFTTVVACFVSCIIYYCICTGIGYLIRKYVTK